MGLVNLSCTMVYGPFRAQTVVSKTDMVSLSTVNIMELSDSQFGWQYREVEEKTCPKCFLVKS